MKSRIFSHLFGLDLALIDSYIQLPLSMDAQNITAVCAVFISVISLIVSMRAMYIQRVHNKKSVKPIGQITLGDYTEELYVRLDNNGTGPLVVTNVIVTYLNVQYPSLIGAIPQFIKEPIHWVTFVEEGNEKSILPGKSLILLKALHGGVPNKKLITVEDNNFSALRKALGQCTISISYTDIYGSTPITVTRTLTRFATGFAESLKELFEE